MSPEKQRIAVAEICGTMKWAYALPVKVVHCDVPKYDSLDDMREAKAKLNPEQSELFRKISFKVVTGVESRTVTHLTKNLRRELFHAAMLITASQEREAFLRTFNRWEE